MHDDDQPDRYCVSDDHCRAYDAVAKHPAYVPARDPMCDTCLNAAEPDVRALVVAYLDLAQLQAPSLSQALDTQPGGSVESPMLLRGAPEALQAEIVHVLTTWEAEVRARARLSDPPAEALPGAAVQRAVTILAPRLRLLARIEPTAVYPTGCEDDPQDVAGWEAVHHLQQLRRRARGMLGWTHRTFWVPGACPNVKCGRHDLYRAEPRDAHDDPSVTCDHCGTWRSYGEYEAYVAGLVWPGREATTAAA
jgi:hypothetical protein